MGAASAGFRARREAAPWSSEGRAAQLALLLASGGDERLALDPVSRRNRYGVPAAPAPTELWLSSSTASAVSPRGWAAAGESLDQLLAGELAIGGWLDDIRARLTALYGAPGTEAVLCASGTEAELAALQLALAMAEGPVVNILVAPAETGSGAPAAAAGRHFLRRSSLGGPVARGAPLAGWEDAQVTLQTIEIRRPDGAPRTDADIDQEAALRAHQAVDAGAFVILHVLDASKTGQAGVSRLAARRIVERHCGRVLGLVDACQLRSPPETLRADLEAGLAVMITGSKFAGGPPFSGALLLPAKIAARVAEGPAAGPALAPYSAVFDWPARLRPRFAGRLEHGANLGLGLRWTAALAEIEAYEALSPQLRQRILARFHEAVLERIAADPGLVPLDCPSSKGAPGLVCVVHRGGAGAKGVYEALKTPADPAARPIHLGQPVVVGERTALRVCASMPMVIAAAQTGFAALEADLDALFEAWAALRAGG